MMKLRGERKQDALIDGDYRYCGVAAAMVGAAVIGGVASSSASSKASKAQTSSANAANASQLSAQREAQEFQQRQADQARADREPWRQMGVNKLAELGTRTAQGGDLMRTFGMSDFEKDPGYQFRMDEGMRGMTNSAAARGNLLSGAALKAASQYNQNFASNEFGNASNRFTTNQTNQFNRLASLADVGQVAANQNASGAMQLGQSVGNGMMQTGQAIGNNQIGAGNARASGYIGQANALTGSISQLGNWYQNNQLMNKLGGYRSNGDGSGSNPYAGYDAEANGGWGIE